MIKFLVKIIILVLLIGLGYGLWLIYQEKSPEEKEAVREKISRTVEGAARTLGEAGKKAGEKGMEVIRGGGGETSSEGD